MPRCHCSPCAPVGRDRAAPFADVRLAEAVAPSEAVKRFLDQNLSMVILADVGNVIGDTHDRFRRKVGAYDEALGGLRLLRDRGIKEAGFVVLTESAMPGILAEVSFVSSPTDEQKLRSDGYREQIAEALYKGIARYAASSRGLKVASAAK